MFPWKKDLSEQQKNFSSIKNTHEYIIVHHTATPKWSLEGNIKVLLGQTKSDVSAHALVDWDGSAYKLWKSEQTLWHAGRSNWKNVTGLNFHSIGIEIIGPTDWDFSNEQRWTVKALIGHYMAIYNIPVENVLRHADITWEWSRKGQLWDWKSPARKVDVANSLWKNFKSWDDYRRSIVPKAL